MRRLALAFTLAFSTVAAVAAVEQPYPSMPTSSPMTTVTEPQPPAPATESYPAPAPETQSPPPTTSSTQTPPPATEPPNRAVVVVIGNPDDGSVDPTGEIEVLRKKGYLIKVVWNPTYTDLERLPNDAIVVIVAHMTNSKYPDAPPPPEVGPWYKTGDYYFWPKPGAPSKPAKHVLECLDDHPAVYVCSCYSMQIEHLESNIHGLAPAGIHSEQVPPKLDQIVPPVMPPPPSMPSGPG